MSIFNDENYNQLLTGYHHEIHTDHHEKAHSFLGELMRAFVDKDDFHDYEETVATGNMWDAGLMVGKMLRGIIDDVELDHYEKLIRQGHFKEAHTLLHAIFCGQLGHIRPIRIDAEEEIEININIENITIIENNGYC